MTELTMNLDVEELHDHSMLFFDSYGRLMAEWAAVERALFAWFYTITEMKDGMARAVFYSAKSFNSRSEMLESAFEFATNQTASEMAFIKAALKKARGYSGFRNSVVHGEPSLEVIHEGDGRDADVQYVLMQGKNVTKSSVVSIDDLDNAFDNYVELKTLIVKMLPKHRPPGATPEQYLEQVIALPNPPNSKRTRSGAKPPPPTQEEISLERKRILARRAAAGMNAGMMVRVRSKEK